MKTKFSPIVRVRKLGVDKAQKVLRQLDAKLEELEGELLSLHSDVERVHVPSSGSFSLIRQNAHIVTMLREEIHALEFAREALRMQKAQAAQLVKNAMLELEKIEHLHKEEMMEIFARKAKREAKDLDEMGIMLHAIKERG